MKVYIAGIKHKESFFLAPIAVTNSFEKAQEECIKSFKKVCFNEFYKKTKDIDIKIDFNLVDEWSITLKSKELNFGARYLIRTMDLLDVGKIND